MNATRSAGILALTAALAACTVPHAASAPSTAGALPALRSAGTKAATPIRHVVIVVQENRSFDNFFATFPGADGTTAGLAHDGRSVRLAKVPLATQLEVDHVYSGFKTECDFDGTQCRMDGFDQVNFGSTGQSGNAGTYAYQYVDPNDIAPYWTLAKQYVLADHLFQTQGSGSFTAHQDLIAGGTAIDPDDSIIDLPSRGPWGCDAPHPTVTSLIDSSDTYLFNKGPFPCFHYKTLGGLLTARGLSWKYYVPALCAPGSTGFLWNAYDAIHAVRYGQAWTHNVSIPETNLMTDLAAGQLAAVSWVIPSEPNSDHAAGMDTGPSWVAHIVNAVGKSKFWNSTAIVILWDDWGGYYDHVPPPRLGPASLGFRVPAIVVSPYAKAGYVAHTQYEFGSILKFAEENWKLGTLGQTDVRATSISDVFDFTQPPRAFVPVAAKYPDAYFTRKRPSCGKAPDDA